MACRRPSILDAPFGHRNTRSKPPIRRVQRTFLQRIRRLRGSDPELPWRRRTVGTGRRGRWWVTWRHFSGRGVWSADVRAGRNPGDLPSALHPRRPIRASKHVLRAENQESAEDGSSEDQEVVRVRPRTAPPTSDITGAARLHRAASVLMDAVGRHCAATQTLAFQLAEARRTRNHSASSHWLGATVIVLEHWLATMVG